MTYIDDVEEFEFDDGSYIKMLKKKRKIKDQLWDEFESNSEFVGYDPIVTIKKYKKKKED